MTVPTQFWNGQPALVQNNLPTSHNIASTTNATPIVVTTSTNHGLTTGDVVKIAGATDANANGDFIASVLSLTTFSLLAFPAGTAVAGAGGGGAAGTVLSYSFGVTYPLPSDLTDDMDAASVNVALEALGDRTAYLEYAKMNRFGGGRHGFGGPRVGLTDANHTIDVTQGYRFIIADPASARTITLDHVTGTPQANETIEFLAKTISVAGTRVTFQRIDTTVVATLVGPSGVAAVNPCSVQFEIVAGVYRLGFNSGAAWDPIGTVEYGVIPGAGA